MRPSSLSRTPFVQLIVLLRRINGRGEYHYLLMNDESNALNRDGDAGSVFKGTPIIHHWIYFATWSKHRLSSHVCERLTFREFVRQIAIAANIRYMEIPLLSLPFALGGRHLAKVGRSGGFLAACVRMSQDLTVPAAAAVLSIIRSASTLMPESSVANELYY